MCGILGFVHRTQEISEASLWQGIDAIRHRGPDGIGSFLDFSVGLAHVRLSILDLTSAGAQPLITPSGRFIISYNGEVYNFQEIANQFNLKNRCSRTDTEVIALAFEIIGPALFSQLNGMFVFAIYDRYSQKIWLVRDRLGIKSLYYKNTDGNFWFASEIKGIFAMEGNASRELCQDTLHEWSYFGSSLGENSLFKNIKRLLPGHYLEVDVKTGKIVQQRYWSPLNVVKNFSENNLISQNELIKKTKTLLELAVRRQLISDVPIGVFLSGGIDSSAITAFASQHYQCLSTYSVAFDFYKTENELQKASLIAKKFGTQHHEIFIRGVDIADVVEKMIYHHDSPFADAANIPLFLLCSQIKDKNKVVLQGDGGDELFGGYQRYKTLSNLNKMKKLAKIGRFINYFMPKNKSYYLRQRYINALLAENDVTMMALLLTVEDRREPPLLIFSEKYRKIFANKDPFLRYRQVEQLYAHQSIVDRMFSVDQEIILPDIFLEKVDKSSMAASVEVRVPFLDNDLVDFCISLSDKQKLGPGQQKWLLKKSLEGILPSEILCGKKCGFGVPYGYWLKNSLIPLFKDHLSKFNENNPGVMDMAYIKSIYDDHCAERREHGFLLWKLLNFLIWSNYHQIKIYA